MTQPDRLSVTTEIATHGWCDHCGWMLGPVTRHSDRNQVARAATTHATSYPDHVVHMTTAERTTMKHVRWQETQPAAV